MPRMLDLSKMNPQQREAVLATEGPVLVLAGAGSGKTRVLTHRVAHLVLDKGVPPENVLAITFTNKATREMKDRIGKLVGREAGLIRVGTFHRTCLDMLRSYPSLVGLPAKFNLVSQDDAKKLITRICLTYKEAPEPGPTMAAISRAKNELVTPEEMLKKADPRRPHEELTARVYAEYDESLRDSKVLDLDDILVESHRLLVENPQVLDTYRSMFRYIHVDEYQDTCHAQYCIVSLLAAKHQNLMVVGDEDQAIYSWRAADVRNILNFESDYPGAKVITLGVNYRSTPNILAVASSVIARNTQRRPKALTTPNRPGRPVGLLVSATERDEAESVVQGVRAAIRGGTPAAEVAVLYRVATLSSDLETAFLRAGIRYEVVRGTRYVDRKVVRDAIAYINTAVHPDDEISLRRIANVPKRGLGDATLNSVSEAAKRLNLTMREAIEQASKGQLPLAPKGRTAVADLVRTLDEVKEAMSVPRLADQVRGILEATGLLMTVPKAGDTPDNDSAGDLLKLVDIADALSEENPEADMTSLLDFLALQSEADEVGEDASSKVKLLTIHAAKGLEFDTVFVVGVEDGILPHRRALLDPDNKTMEEERRLAYVAITRAKSSLTLSYVQVRRLFGERKSMPPSRFLRDIPERFLQRARF